jgi:hypothetical protein
MEAAAKAREKTANPTLESAGNKFKGLATHFLQTPLSLELSLRTLRVLSSQVYSKRGGFIN